MDLMTDNELELVIAANGVRKLEIVKDGEKEFYLVVTLTSGVERGLRMSRGGQRRTWASMDRLCERLESYANSAKVILPPISLVMAPQSMPQDASLQ